MTLGMTTGGGFDFWESPVSREESGPERLKTAFPVEVRRPYSAKVENRLDQFQAAFPILGGSLLPELERTAFAGEGEPVTPGRAIQTAIVSRAPYVAIPGVEATCPAWPDLLTIHGHSSFPPSPVSQWTGDWKLSYNCQLSFIGLKIIRLCPSKSSLKFSCSHSDPSDRGQPIGLVLDLTPTVFIAHIFIIDNHHLFIPSFF